jgi:hypothetical protein
MRARSFQELTRTLSISFTSEAGTGHRKGKGEMKTAGIPPPWNAHLPDWDSSARAASRPASAATTHG